ncbi:Trimethyllysine dioxygenase [Neurospora tetraspora]|uniref:trimethyllysine dioxygenase n=1 Tax=Neurospora tetraspora TaxID=94610 RepID=A0AAE0MVF7_9PEZI|nr:Trimethyllysine dioxygenase [Neurospora tetraspora]
MRPQVVGAILRSRAVVNRQVLSKTRLCAAVTVAKSLSPIQNSRRTFASSLPRLHEPKAEITAEGLQLSPPQAVADGKRTVLPNFWLRDNCRCTKCVNQDTLQRNFNTFAVSSSAHSVIPSLVGSPRLTILQIPSDIHPTKVEATKENVTVQWSDNHTSTYPWPFLSSYLTSNSRVVGRENDVQISLWGSEAIGSRPPTVSFPRVMASSSLKGVADLTSMIKEFGFCFVKDTPHNDPDVTRQLLERIAFIRVTHYGGFYDFTPDLAMADTAYTNLALPAHTDTTYFTEPAGLQAFHLLEHKPAPVAPGSGSEGEGEGEVAVGGKSLLVDGFNAARILKQEDPKAYEILSSVRLPWHASGNAGITIAPDKLYPVLELDEDTGELHRVRWNNDDRGVVPFGEKYSPSEWYEAARKWDGILRRRSSELWVQLEPGKPLIFDNWRVLHGRSAFSGIRRICGGYINRDDFISRWRNTNYPRSEVLPRVTG